MTKTFEAQVTEWARKSEARLNAVAKTAIQSVVEDIVTGTPVDTGFLRASFTVTKGSPTPIGQGVKPVSGQSYQIQPYALTINSVKSGDTVFGVFAANYATYVEFGANGRAGVRMVGLAVQKWPQYVNEAVRLAKGITR